MQYKVKPWQNQMQARYTQSDSNGKVLPDGGPWVGSKDRGSHP